MNRPSVRIVATNWNGGEEPLALLRSIAALAYPPDRLETVVVDNASTDGSPDRIAAEFPGVRLIRNRSNRGFGPAINQGAADAQTDYLFLANDDIVLEPMSLSALVDALEGDPSIGIAGGRVVAKDDPARTLFSGKSLSWFTGQQRSAPDPDLAKDVGFIEASSLLIRRELWQRLGGFDERFVPAYWEDVDLALRARNLGFRCRYVPTARFRHRQGASVIRLPLQRIYGLGLENRLRLYAKHRGRGGMLAFLLRHWLLSVPGRTLVRRDGSLPAEVDALRFVARHWVELGRR